MEKLATGNLADATATECLHMLGELSSYHGLPKIQLPKLVGKELASDIDGKLGAITSFSRLLQGALAKLCSLSAGSATEELLFDGKVTALFKEIKDKTVIKQLEAIVPSWTVGISKVVAVIEKSVANFMEQATSTFHGFILRILDAEVNLETVLTTAIVGALDQDDKAFLAGVGLVLISLVAVGSLSLIK